MGNRENELFIGKEFLSLEGRSIKHPALIKHYTSANPNKLRDAPIDIHGIDLETNHETGELMLLGIYNDQGYFYYIDEFPRHLYWHVKAVIKEENSALAYWNRLDPFIILRTLVQDLPHHEQERALMRFGKEGGEWDKKSGTWSVDPLVKLEFGGHEFGIKNAIRSSIQFYMINDNNKLKTVWAYDIAQLFPGGLEKEAARFDWYSKVDESAHLVNWVDFASDTHYRDNIVLKSNKLDARACRELAYSIQEDFKRAFGHYANSLISQGALARAAIVATIYNEKKNEHVDEHELKRDVRNDVKAIGFMNYYDEIAKRHGGNFVKDLYAMLTEAYSGGLIEATAYGTTEKAYYADLASAYPSVTKDLYDLRGATWSHGTGTPERAKQGYTIIRGTVHVPEHVNVHPLTVKHPLYKDTNIRPTGTFKASYTIEERDFLLEEGATFEDEEWYKVETKGKKSPLARATTEFVNLRKRLKDAGDSAEWMAKSSAASVYGITYEATDIHGEFEKEKDIVINEHIETFYKDILAEYRGKINLEPWRGELRKRLGDKYYRIFAMWHHEKSQTPDQVKMEIEEQGIMINSDHPADIMLDIDELYRMPTKSIEKETVKIKDTERIGYRAGEFWNPLFATIITAFTRIKMARAARAIEKNGGQVIIMMTDSITWTGGIDMIPSDMVKEPKTLGYFETPEEVHDIVCLGSGRYGFKMWNRERSDWSNYEAKRRGLNAVDIHDPNGVSIGAFDWSKILSIMKQEDSTTINIKVRTLISPGIVVNSNKYTLHDLGRIVEQEREIQCVVGKSKRDIKLEINDPKRLASEMINTKPLHLDPSMYGTYKIDDQSLPLLRKSMMEKIVETRHEKYKKNVRKGKNKHYKKNRAKIRLEWKQKYNACKAAGYDALTSKEMAHWSFDRLKKYNIYT